MIREMKQTMIARIKSTMETIPIFLKTKEDKHTFISLSAATTFKLSIVGKCSELPVMLPSITGITSLLATQYWP